MKARRVSSLRTAVAWGVLVAGVATAPVAASPRERRWHRVTLTFEGPVAGEDGTPNPFTDYRLEVTFIKGTRRLVVPGHFAADGQAAQTGATRGRTWRAYFTPDEEGIWRWQAALRAGPGVALAPSPGAGRAVALRPARGSFEVGASDAVAPDLRSQGALRETGQRYLAFAGTGAPFLKGGTDSPENLLAFADFDGTPPKHHYQPHVGDVRPGDPLWRGDKGKGLLGAINYLASQGVNSMYFLTMNVGGDGQDVWPWTTADERTRFDVSKLDQWEMVFSHMEQRGVAMHVVTQETENDQLLDGGALGSTRKLYLRELVSRFGHHLAVTWNLGEENSNTDDQRKKFATYLRGLDVYAHPTVVHTFPHQYDRVYDPLLGFPAITGPSLQMWRIDDVHSETLKWLDRSARAGKPWVVTLDEIGPDADGVVPDADDPTHDAVRKRALWGNLMAGGAGAEWYFGWKHAHADLTAEDFRSRAGMWAQTRYALEFFKQFVPFTQLTHHDGLTSAPDDYVLADVGRTYVVYLPGGGSTLVDLGSVAATFRIDWYDPRRGGVLQTGTLSQVKGPGWQALGAPPREPTLDWVAIVRLTSTDERDQTDHPVSEYHQPGSEASEALRKQKKP